MSRQFVSPDIRGRVSSAKTPIWVLPFHPRQKNGTFLQMYYLTYINNCDTLN